MLSHTCLGAQTRAYYIVACTFCTPRSVLGREVPQQPAEDVRCFKVDVQPHTNTLTDNFCLRASVVHQVPAPASVRVKGRTPAKTTTTKMIRTVQQVRRKKPRRRGRAGERTARRRSSEKRSQVRKHRPTSQVVLSDANMQPSRYYLFQCGEF